jgi:predicted acyltransferase
LSSRAGAIDTPQRLVSLDAYRGFTMLLMVSSGLGIPAVAEKFKESNAWQILGYQFDHVPWVGCSLWDLIQPSFMFMVGVAIPFSYASRRAKGESPGRIWFHAFIRSVVLIFLGVFLLSNWSRQTNWTFVNVLTQIGLGYMFVFALRGAGMIVQILVAALILTGYGAVFVYSGFDVQRRKPIERPIPVMNEENFRRAHAGPHESFEHDPYAAHWAKNMNFASDADEKFLSALRRDEPLRFPLFGREWASYLFYRADAGGTPEPYTPNDGGYTTLNFVPSIATMIFGLIAGEWMRRNWRGGVKFVLLVVAGSLCLLVGLTLDHYIWPDWLTAFMARMGDTSPTGLDPFFKGYSDGSNHWPWTTCPTIKRIWTPTWTVFSAGWTILALAGFYVAIDICGWKR